MEASKQMMHLKRNLFNVVRAQKRGKMRKEGKKGITISLDTYDFL